MRVTLDSNVDAVARKLSNDGANMITGRINATIDQAARLAVERTLAERDFRNAQQRGAAGG